MNFSFIVLAKKTRRLRAGVSATLQSKHLMSSIRPIREVTKIRQLLSACGLPVSDIVSSNSLLFFGCSFGSDLAGVVGLEILERVALLRSLAVATQYRNSNLGSELMSFAETQATSIGVHTLFLLTTTAEGFFLKHGYTHASRVDAPESIKSTAQFSGICPASSSFMSKPLCEN